MKKLKEQYPNISIAQFRDIYHEDIVMNPKFKELANKEIIKIRSYSFFKAFFKKYNYESTFKHRYFRKGDSHPLRDASPRRGILVMIDGTPHDWFDNGNKFSLHQIVSMSNVGV